MNDTARALSSWRQALCDSRLLIFCEIALVASVFIADQHHLILFSKTPYLLVLGWLSMWLRGVRWRDIGLRLKPNWTRLVLAGILAGVAMEALELFVTQPLLASLTGKLPDLSDFKSLVGNWKITLLLIGGAWTLAAFGEEMVWRGYLMNRIAGLFGNNAIAWALSLVLVNAAFGYAHAYQDITGIIENFVAGMLLGLLYLASGRNLIVPIVAHGMTDTIDASIIFSGHYPGM
jgi:membrane protease YdiL (CAAX protease family)